MKLRNKKTGEIEKTYITMDGDKIAVIVADMPLCGNSVLGEYDSLAELNEEWEDYEPAEPLIKDEKIRKAVRAWAEANNINLVRVVGVRTLQSEHRGIKIEFNADLFVGWVTALETIEELCGDEDD